MIKPRPFIRSEVTVNQWNEFYTSVYPPRGFPTFIPTINYIPELEKIITLNELEITLKKTKNNKATGPDGLSNEFYKASASGRA